MLIKKMIAAEYAKYMLQLKSELNYFKIPLSIENIKQLIKDKINEIESNLLDTLYPILFKNKPPESTFL